jgi:hypothetical protein
MTIPSTISILGRRRSYALREAVLACFAQDPATIQQSLSPFRDRDWQRNLTWLDTSGLALYLLHHLTTLRLTHLLPAPILRRLQQNHADNSSRNTGLLHEAVAMTHAFQHENLSFAHLKGFSLWPDSVPDPALRCQLDLDLLIRDEDAPTARDLLERMGYRLDVIVGNTWEFRTGGPQVASLKDLYKSKAQRSADLHLAPATGLLERVHIRSFSGHPLPVLSPVDQYLAQAQHLFKHMCYAFTRVSWLLELRRHTLARQHENQFWLQIKQRLVEEPKYAVALGVTSLLLATIFGDAPPASLAAIEVSPSIRLWVQLYARKALLADFPGTKLYLLLLAELQPTTRRKHLLPLQPPPRLTDSYTGETTLSKLRRQRIQLHFLVFRLRFHSVEGIRYLVESFRFRRLLTGLAH